jgi:hypothetical protein
LYGVETWTLRKTNQEHFGNFEMWRCRRMEKIHWIGRVDKVFRAVKKERTFSILKPKAGYILRRNTLLQQRQTGREEKKEDVNSYSITLGNEKTPDVERGSTRSHFVENSLWKSLWTCRQTDYVMVIDLINVRVFRCLFNGKLILYRIERMYKICYETREYG